MALNTLPTANFGKAIATGATPPVVPAATLASTGVPASTIQTTLYGPGQIIPVVYGRFPVGGLLANGITVAGVTTVVVVWAYGECDAVESVTHGDDPLPASVTVTHYLGTAGQTVDATVAAAFAAQGISYTDALPHVCYSVLSFPSSVQVQWQALGAIIRGRKCYDERSGLTVWTENPALHLADFLASTTYGAARTVDQSTVGAVADACDVLMADGEPFATLGLALAAPRPPKEWADTLASYAFCWVVEGNAGLKLVADGPRATDASYSHAAGDIVRIANIKGRGLLAAPTSVACVYTDTSALPWRDRTSDPVDLPSFAGEARPQTVPAPGIRSASQAKRWNTRRLNGLSLADLSFDLYVLDKGMAHEVGDVVEVTYPFHGFSAKKMRVAGEPERDNPKVWRLPCIEYDPAAYSTAVVTEPSSPDTTLPSPADPQPVTLNPMTEEVFQYQNEYKSRLRVSWSADTQLRAGYRFQLVKQGGLVVASGPLAANATAWESGPVEEGKLHNFSIWTVGILGNESDEVTASYTPEGKDLLPPDVASLQGLEVGGEVRLWWPAVAEIGPVRYEIRYGAAGVAWSAATALDRVDALRWESSSVAEGTYDFLIKALDNVVKTPGSPGQYSANAVRKAITVTSDANAKLVDSVDLATATVSNMTEITDYRDPTNRMWVTDDGTTWDSLFPLALDTYTNPLASYSAGAASSIVLPSGSSGYDFGLSLSGSWQGELSVDALVGSPVSSLGLSSDGISFTDHTLMSAKVTERYGRLKATAGIGESMIVSAPTANIRITAVGRPFTADFTSDGTGKAVVDLTSIVGEIAAFNGTPTVQLTGTTAGSATVDNLVTGATPSLDVYTFDATGVPAASRSGSVSGSVLS